MGSHQNTVQPDELLARFIFHSRYIRSDNTVKSDAFIPYPYPDLSVTRHLELNEDQLEKIGRLIAQQQQKNLHGRADISTNIVLNFKLTVELAPVQRNPNHANITGWPSEKSAQKIIALQIAASKPAMVKY